MFELKIALKYLIPKPKNLSTALISLMSVAVISLVVWLVIVFLSVTSGIEKNWLTKLTSLYAPIRITPTDNYYQSYYYLIDNIASDSNYSFKTIGEKAISKKSDPYSPDIDMEIPSSFPVPELDSSGTLKDPIKIAQQTIASLGDITFQDYEISGALLKLTLTRDHRNSTLSQMSYLLSLTDQNPNLSSLLLSPTQEDLKNGSQFIATVENGKLILPTTGEIPILMPKSFRDSKVLIGDRGVLCYTIPTLSASQEQKIPIRVAGFYDPGFISLGNRCLIVPNHLTRLISASSQTFSPDGTPVNGYFLWPKQFKDVHCLVPLLQKKFKENGIDQYWKITSYENFEFSKDLIQQFRSDKTLFTLIAGIILLVACSNIISLLILLINDKKKEIAILQSMGATHKSIGFIFTFCGVIMGLLSCLFGSIFAVFTLRHLESIVSLLSSIQGKIPFHPVFLGGSLPKEITSDALWFVFIATPILSLLAGLIPALKACKIRPSSTLRSE